MRAKIFVIWMLCFLLGALIAPFFEVDPAWWLIICLILAINSFLLYQKRYLWATVIGLAFIFLSIYQYQNQFLDYTILNTKFAGAKNEYIGSVGGIPTQVEHGKKVSIDLQAVNDREQKGKITIYTKDFPTVKFSEIINFQAKLKPYGTTKNRLIKDRIIGEASVTKFEKIGENRTWEYRFKGWLFGIRQSFNEVIRKNLPQKEASLASGLILGEKSFISPEFNRALQNSGTSHIIALSGYNITIILSLFILFQRGFSRRLNLILPLLFIIFFVVMTGASASIVRAGIMGFMPIIARYLGRSSNSFIAILFSASLMVFINPFIVLYDVGFQLSFTALCGMLYLGPIVARLFSSLPETTKLILSETVGAQLAALPLLVFYFGRVSIISPISNLIILSLVPLGMLVSFLVGVFGLFMPWLAPIVSIPGYILLHLFYILINFFGNLPFASYQFKINSVVWLVVSYLLIIDLLLADRKYSRTERSYGSEQK